jgi:hypothetical protein
VIAAVLRVPKKNPARSMVDVSHLDRWIHVQLVPVDLHAAAVSSWNR